MDGIVILDKPSGPTSREVVEQVKSLLGVKIAGHVGTLDPRATGVLPILLGRATRVAIALERLDKEYVAVVHLHKDISDAELRGALNRFVGAIEQLPPVKSAVARKVRTRKVYSIDILGREGKDVRLRIACEAGTYIRKLASDLGLKVGGAHLKELRRTRSGPFGEKDAHTIEDIQKTASDNSLLRNSLPRQIILPIERAVAHLPRVIVKDSAIAKVMSGSPLFAIDISQIGDFEKDELVAVMSLKGELLALGRPTKKAVRIERVVTKA